MVDDVVCRSSSVPMPSSTWTCTHADGTRWQGTDEEKVGLEGGVNEAVEEQVSLPSPTEAVTEVTKGVGGTDLWSSS